MSWQRLMLVVLAAGALAACSAGRTGREFRQRLAGLQGQSIQLVIADLGPTGARTIGTNRHYGWSTLTIGRFSRECSIRVNADPAGRIVEATMHGSDHDCGSMLTDLRRSEARYRANPGLREREAQEADALVNQLLEARRQLNEIDPR